MVKLSELKDDDILMLSYFAHSRLLTKREVVEELDEIKRKIEEYKSLNFKLYTTTEYLAKFNAISILDSIIENESCNMYEDWDDDINKHITDEDIKELQVIFNRILSRGNNITYWEDKEIEIDM